MRSLSWILLIFFGLIINVNGHLWLRYPISRGGNGFSGASNGPCGGKIYGTGQKTILQAKEEFHIVLRANKIGNAPSASFTVLFSRNSGDITYDIVLASNVTVDISEGNDDFKLILIKSIVPDTPCKQCSIQVQATGLTGPKGKYYNCADVEVIPDGSKKVPKILSISPKEGPTTGGTAVSLVLNNFDPEAIIQCKFELVEVPATIVSGGVGDESGEKIISCETPPRNVPKDAVVEVIVDGVISSSGVTFKYTGEYIDPVITSINPSKGYPQTTVTVVGENFFSPNIQCRVGDLIFNGAVSGNTCRCRIPGSSELTSSNTIAIDISVDGSPYSESEILFEFLAGPKPEEIIGISIFFFILLVILLGFALGLKTGFIEPQSFLDP